MNEKFQKLEKILKEMESIIIAFSGGIDSALLTKIAFDILGKNVLAVTIDSLFLSKKELADAEEFVKTLGVPFKIVNIDILKDKRISKNNSKRCYYCKKEILNELLKIAKDNNISFVVDASNYDDLSDYRPGLKASKELNIRHPFIEANIRKDEIRKYAKKLGLSIWNKPSSACLASRIPYENEITEKKLKMIEEAENYLKDKGFRYVRVRFHKDIARIEIKKDTFNKLIKSSDELIKKFKEIGFLYITLDLEGFRSGSMNIGVEYKN